MERFKVVERETKTKAYSKEGITYYYLNIPVYFIHTTCDLLLIPV